MCKKKWSWIYAKKALYGIHCRRLGRRSVVVAAPLINSMSHFVIYLFMNYSVCNFHCNNEKFFLSMYLVIPSEYTDTCPLLYRDQAVYDANNQHGTWNEESFCVILMKFFCWVNEKIHSSGHPTRDGKFIKISPFHSQTP